VVVRRTVKVVKVIKQISPTYHENISNRVVGIIVDAREVSSEVFKEVV
jgi:hypothetical protein